MWPSLSLMLSVRCEIADRFIVSDFTQLGVEVMLSGVALSLAEEILSEGKQKK